MKSIYRANLFIRALFIVFLGGSFLLQMLWSPLGLPLWLRSLIRYLLLFGAVSVLFMRHTGLRMPDVGFRRPEPLSLAAGFALGFLLQPLLLLLSALTEFLFPNPVSGAMGLLLQDPLPLVLLSSALVPAFFEEWACRGIYLSDWTDRRPLQAAACSGLAFAMLHFNLQQFPYAFVFGFLIALLALGTGSVWPGILAHGLINASQLLLAAFPAAWLNDLSMIAMAAVPSTGISLWILYALYQRREHPVLKEGLTLPEMMPLVHAVVIFIAAILVLR